MQELSNNYFQSNMKFVLDENQVKELTDKIFTQTMEKINSIIESVLKSISVLDSDYRPDAVKIKKWKK